MYEKEKYSIDFKKQVVKEAKETSSLAAAARRHELSANMASYWKRELESDVLFRLNCEFALFD
ncbi:transposase [Aneurinibacillus aneurinilyticus]|uniref:transposase n=1 Tax=Aneurinibacillus aneurinilyticus TaxID=1391 RepID=UPI002E1C6819|nr:transposase [Aneurinibacillus aneurinilyticus]MED0670460.1 transposase [Aneurinibacillus aneurinilyticus]